jgi:hypothetical protein
MVVGTSIKKITEGVRDNFVKSWSLATNVKFTPTRLFLLHTPVDIATSLIKQTYS